MSFIHDDIRLCSVFPLAATEIVEVTDSEEISHAFTVTFGNESMMLVASSFTEKRSWMEEIIDGIALAESSAQFRGTDLEELTRMATIDLTVNVQHGIS